MSRRISRRGLGGRMGAGIVGGGPSYGGKDWDASTTLGTSGSSGLTGIIGDSAGFWVACLASYSVVPSGSEVFASYLNGNTGWELLRRGAGGITFRCGSGAGLGDSPVYTPAVGDVDKLNLYVGVHMGSGNLIRLWASGVEMSAGTFLSGYGQPATGYMAIGSRQAAAFPATSFCVYGLSGGHGIPTDSQIQGLYSAVKRTHDIAGISGMTTHLYSVKKDVAGASFPSTINDQTASDDMTFVVGSASNVNLNTVAVPTFTW